MTRYAFNSNPPILAPEGQAFVGPDGTGYPANWIENSTAPLRTARDIYPVTEADAPADGQYIASEELQLVADRPVAVATYADLPTPTIPRIVTRLQYTLALAHLDPTGIVFGAVEALPASNVSRRYFEDTPNFDRDDPRYDAVEAMLGATETDTDAAFAYASTIAP